MTTYIDYNSPDNVYYNIIIPGKEGEETLARYESTRVETIINNPCNYYLTVVRFSVPGDTLPLFIFPVLKGPTQSDPNKSNLSFTLSFGGNDEQYYLQFTPTNTPFSVPKAPSDNNGVQDITPYYYVYNMNHFLEILNNGIAQVVANFKTNYPAVLPSGFDEDPYFLWDSSEKKFILIIQRVFVEAGVELFVNRELFRFLENISKAIFNGFNASNGKVYKFDLLTDPIFRNYDNAYFPPAITPISPPNLLQFKQTVSQLVFFYSFKKFLFISNHLPIRREFSPSRNQINNPFGGDGINNSTPILTDFEPALNVKSGDLRENFNYFSDGRYKLIDMCNNSPLRKIDLQIFWTDQENNVYPLTINDKSQISVKLLFLKKTLEINI